MRKSYIVIHNSGAMNEPQFESINRYHMRRGFPVSSLGYYGGYHLLIDTDEKVKRYREDRELGAHARQRMMNFRSIGVCVAGDFTRQKPKEWQIQLLREVIVKLQIQHGIPLKNVLLHKNISATACPGIDWREHLFNRAIEIQKTDGGERIKENVLRRLKRRLKHFI